MIQSKIQGHTKPYGRFRFRHVGLILALTAFGLMLVAPGFTSTAVTSVAAAEVSALPQATPEKPLNEPEVDALLDVVYGTSKVDGQLFPQ